MGLINISMPLNINLGLSRQHCLLGGRCLIYVGKVSLAGLLVLVFDFVFHSVVWFVQWTLFHCVSF